MKKIFIGSSSHAIEKARVVETILKKLGAHTTCWADDTAFALSHNTIDNLVEAAHNNSAGLFIFDKDDRIVNEYDNQNDRYIPRDNVIAEAGIFTGVLGIKSVALCVVPGIHEISDFKGITHLTYDVQNMVRLENQLHSWLENDVKDYGTSKCENNILMLSRRDIHARCSIDDRLHISDGLYKNIRRVRMLNFASNLIINPEIADEGHETPGIGLSDSLEKILAETRANVELILTEPNQYNLTDVETKIANRNAGTADGTIYSALYTIYQNLSGDTVYQYAAMQKRFHLYVMKISMPFAVFNVEFSYEYRHFNHVKIDLYSAALGNEDDRRSFIIWQKEDPINYSFFIDNFNSVKLDPRICTSPTLSKLKAWADKWINNRY